ncbi:hypothetical protein [Blastococcus sp. URHD0036]|uniref:hypothetical protein n=1 Tax=Blastococcus sp. URHD0036 TaxID=1380356 RepID=UPI0004975A94|nr:hypothetical protein [Blastococcus sp. URHD0036]
MRTRLPLVLAVSAALIAGCSADDGDDATAAPTTATTTATTTASATPPGGSDAGGSDAGCPATDDGIPSGAATRPTLDVDGDRAADTEWIASSPAADGSVLFGVTTASGATVTADLQSASPVARSILVADVTGDGELVVLASDGRQVLLYAYSDCQIVPVQNPQGEQYAFDLGFTGYGTGVGCLDVDGDGVRDLAGLLVNGDGTGYTATAVVLDGPRASNSDVSMGVADAGAAAVEAARSITCGDLTMTDDGVTTGP